VPQDVQDNPIQQASDRMVSGSMVSHGFLNMQVDQANMYIAPLVICTPAEDRDAEVTDPEGILDTEYRRNPLVFFNHSHKFDPSLPPVGTAETPDRKYNCFRKGGEWYSGCRFSQASKLGAQTFALVVDGVIRGRSIGGLTHDMEFYRPKAPGKAFHKGEIVPLRTKSVTRTLVELVEWSWCPIQSNREVVTMVKSVLSRKRVDGMPLDGQLERMLRSLELREPEASTKNMRRTPHRLRSDALWTTKGKDMAGQKPVAVRFDTKNYTPTQAVDLLKRLAEDGDLKNTPLQVEETGGSLFLRSTQLDYSGDVQVMTDDRMPGLQLLFAKGGYFTKQEDTDDANATQGGGAPAQDEADIVEQIVNDMEANAVVVDEGAAGGEAAAKPVEKPAATKPKPEGPKGSQFLRAFAKYLEDGVGMAEAGLEEQEPELLAKCGEFVETLREFVGKIKETHDERYAAKKEATPNGDMTEEVEEGAEEAEEAEEVDAAVAKALRADVFYGRRKLVPLSFMQQVREAQSALSSGDADKAKKALQLVAKSCTVPVVPKVDQRKQNLDALAMELRAELERREIQKRLARLR